MITQGRGADERRGNRTDAAARGWSARRTVAAVALAALSQGMESRADFIGWTSTTRAVTGGYLVNVFAVTDNPTDTILNVQGSGGFIATTSPGGFLQSAARPVFAPFGSQNWTVADSFLTVGGSFSMTTMAWLANSASQGDPPWNVTYTDTDTGEATTVVSFNTPSNESGFSNPNLNSVPANAGWFLAGSTSPARSLASIASIRNPYGSACGINYGSSSAAAAIAANGFLVAQFFVAEFGGSRHVDWRMGATIRRSNGTISVGVFEMRIGDIGCNDVDGDGVPNSSDACPNTPGSCANGCPPNACGTCGKTPDINADGVVNGADLGLLLTAWGACTGTCAADLDRSNSVNGADLSILLAEWGSCGG